jgi:eukaryotic-like serine/threonine-protein kinase
VDEGAKSQAFGRYTLHDKIAAGGMATIHAGRLVGPVGFARTVAIKRLRSHFAEEPEFVAMFLDEARLAARIRHPNVVPTLDVVAVEGELLLVMEYVQGESLSRLLRAAGEKNVRPPPEIVVSIMTGVLHGLHAAHEARDESGEPLGVVHRDVSPQNILVGVDGVARVLDFGVAKAAGRLQTTRDGQIKGKLSYMAPEQVLSRPVDRRTDVYGASAVLWEALTGKRLFIGDNDGATLHNVLQGVVEPPSAHAPGLPPVLDSLTLRGLSRDPEGRFATAREMARALETAVAPVVASAISDWVESMAKDELEQRSRVIEAVESDAAVKRGVQASSRDVPIDVAPTGMRARANAEAYSLTETSVVSSSEPTPARPPRRRRLVAGAAAVLGVGLLVVVSIVETRGAPESSVVPIAASVAAPVATPVAPPSASVATPADPPVVPASAEPSPSASAARPRATPARQAPSPPSKPQPAKHYVFDHL